MNACFQRASVTIDGAYTSYRGIADSGTVMHRSFCATCGTPLFSEAESRPHLIFIRVGAFDDPELARPQATIWTDQAPSWACIDAALPQHPAQPPPPA